MAAITSVTCLAKCRWCKREESLTATIPLTVSSNQRWLLLEKEAQKRGWKINPERQFDECSNPGCLVAKRAEPQSSTD
jgi:hypothetical protein